MDLFVIILIIVPVLVCNSLASITSRVIVIGVTTSIFIAIMSGFLRVKTVDLFVAGAAYVDPVVGLKADLRSWHEYRYGTVLTLFIGQGGPGRREWL